MIYEKEVVLNTTPEKIKLLLLDYDKYHLWQSTFKGINSVKGIPGETGFVGIINYNYHDDLVQSKVTIDRNDLPVYLVELYETNEIYNRCVHHFIQQDEGILWQQTVFVDLARHSKIQKERFEASTLLNMNAFKQFIESV
ncbi:MAG TPA: hypothetical protein VJY66_00505 [Acholeplasma sp.]|nr:hypothetical protein [Acholeplasma sp.]